MVTKYNVKGPSPYGGKPDNIIANKGCSSYERAYCIQTRAENEPESLLTDVPGVLVCPACGFKINWRGDE
jgi:hypothetical protein